MSAGLPGSGSTADVLRFRVVCAARDDSAVPAVLSRVEPLVVPSGAVRRTFAFTRGPVGSCTGWTINGRPFEPDVPQAVTTLGEVEVWRFVTDVHHPVHVHLDPFQVLRRGTGGPGVHDVGWKDTVDVRPAEIVDVAVRFGTHRGRYVMHCHNLEHEDMAMMATVHTTQVYRWCMSRTNIEIDDELVAEVMRKHGLRTKREAVDLALRRLAGPRLSPEFFEGLRGIGWEGDLDEMRRSKIQDWEDDRDSGS